MFLMYHRIIAREEVQIVKKKYAAITAGTVLAFIMLSGCGAELNSSNTDSSSQREAQLQAEIDALQQEIDDLKNPQGQQNADASDSSQTADSQTADSQTSGSQAADTQTAGNAQTAGSGAGQSGTVAVTLEEAQNIALARVQGATSQNIRIELDRDDGWYIYEGDILYNRVEYEFEIDANTGNILKWEEERW